MAPRKVWEFRADHRHGRVVILLLKKGNVVGVKTVDASLPASKYADKVEAAKAWLRQTCGAPADVE